MRTSMSMGSGVVTMAQATQLLFDPNTDSLKELQFLPFLQLPWSDHKTRLHHTSHSDTIIAFIRRKNCNALEIENSHSLSVWDWETRLHWFETLNETLTFWHPGDDPWSLGSLAISPGAHYASPGPRVTGHIRWHRRSEILVDLPPWHVSLQRRASCLNIDPISRCQMTEMQDQGQHLGLGASFIQSLASCDDSRDSLESLLSRK